MLIKPDIFFIIWLFSIFIIILFDSNLTPQKYEYFKQKIITKIDVIVIFKKILAYSIRNSYL